MLAERVGRGEVDGVTNRVTNTPSGLGYRKALVGIGWANSLLCFLNGLRKCYSLLVEGPIPGCRVSMHCYNLLCSTSLFSAKNVSMPVQSSDCSSLHILQFTFAKCL